MAVIVHNWSEFITAVGTSGADVEFPKSLVKTQDTDVDPNKLYTDANGVVQTNVQPSDLANLYENTFVLDANDYAPAGITSTITISCASINGYGGCIKNLASTTVDIFANFAEVTVDQLTILNINVENVSFIDTTAASVIYTKCIFSGRAKAGSGTHTVFGDVANTHSSAYNSCSFNFDVIGSYNLFNYLNYGGYNYACHFYNCRIEINHTDKDGIPASGNVWVRLDNSYLTGELDSSVYVNITSRSYYSVIEVESAGSILTYDPIVGTIQLILINDELYDGSIPTGCRGVTTAQLKDASYLSSIGFPVQT